MQTVEGFDMGSGGSELLKLREGGAALRQWAAKAVEALKWSESSGGGSGSGSGIRSVRERMVQAARERFLVDAVVDK